MYFDFVSVIDYNQVVGSDSGKRMNGDEKYGYFWCELEKGSG